MQGIQDKDTSTGEVQIEYKRIQNKIPPGHGCLYCVVNRDKKSNYKTIKTKKQERMKYKQRKRIEKSPSGAMYVSRDCCVLSGRGLNNGPIPRPEESYEVCCVIVCDLETWKMRWPWPEYSCCARGVKNICMK